MLNYILPNTYKDSTYQFKIHIRTISIPFYLHNYFHHYCTNSCFTFANTRHRANCFTVCSDLSPNFFEIPSNVILMAAINVIKNCKIWIIENIMQYVFYYLSIWQVGHLISLYHHRLSILIFSLLYLKISYAFKWLLSLIQPNVTDVLDMTSQNLLPCLLCKLLGEGEALIIIKWNLLHGNFYNLKENWAITSATLFVE